MDDEIELDFSFDNDASASSFGWNFQVNAGIFLFLHYIKEAKAIKVESKYEDIEITLKDCKKVFAQAKSSQDECSVGSAKGKFHYRKSQCRTAIFLFIYQILGNQ